MSTSCYLTMEQRLPAFITVSSSVYPGFSRPSLRDLSTVNGTHSMPAGLSHRLEHQPFQWTNLYMTRVHTLACTSPIVFFLSLVVFFTNAFQCGPGNPFPVVIIPHSKTSSALPRIPPPPDVNPWILHPVFYQQSENGLTFSIPCASANVRSMTTTFFSRKSPSLYPCTPML